MKFGGRPVSGALTHAKGDTPVKSDKYGSVVQWICQPADRSNKVTNLSVYRTDYYISVLLRAIITTYLNTEYLYKELDA